MQPNAFIGKVEPPTREELASELGQARALWDELVSVLVRDCGITAQEWNSYSRKAGWALRLKRGERNIVYLSPARGSFTAAFALGDKALAAARRTKLPARILRIIEGAKKYAEGTAVRIEVAGPVDIAAVEVLAAAKIDN